MSVINMDMGVLLGDWSPDVLAAGGLFAVLLVLTVWVYFRRQPPQDTPRAAPSAPVYTPVAPPAAVPPQEPSRHAMREPPPAASGLVVSEHSIATKTGDVLGSLRASLYKALTEMPHRGDLRFKLLQLLYHEGNALEFELHRQLYDQYAQPRQEQIWAGIEKMSAELHRLSKG